MFNGAVYFLTRCQLQLMDDNNPSFPLLFWQRVYVTTVLGRFRLEAHMFWKKENQSWSGFSRRDLFRQSSFMAAVGALGGSVRRLAAAPLEIGANMYRSIGVRPVINARGTFTIISGSQTLPEVKRAMDEASRNYVQMDELMNGVGARLAEITGAEWGIVTAGCCAAVTNCTAASIAGFNPERMQKLPELTGLKNEVVIPSYSRNVYDHAVRMLGVKIVELKDKSELDTIFNERTAMVYILAGNGDQGPLGTKAISDAARKWKVPVVVDAAAEVLTLKPNVHLDRGATAVAYSGGKCMRGPQAAGLLLGEKAWLQAAWANSAPHHAFGRSLKVGKEEIMGMLAAVEMWVKRDHDAEWKQWVAWCDQISASVKKVDGVTTRMGEPREGLSNRTPQLTIQWDGTKLGITGQEVVKLVNETEPRIILAGGNGSRPGNMASSVSVVPYMMMPNDIKIVADRLHQVLSKPPKFEDPPEPQAPSVTVAGQWTAKLEYGRGSATHSIMLEQNADKLSGTHIAEFDQGDLSGTVSGNIVKFQSRYRIQGQGLSYAFTGTVEGDKIAGTVNMGEYGETTWTAERHKYQTIGGRRRG
jgi:D-glucosaminate-6-phosphate ammonia-lyase